MGCRNYNHAIILAGLEGLERMGGNEPGIGKAAIRGNTSENTPAHRHREYGRIDVLFAGGPKGLGRVGIPISAVEGQANLAGYGPQPQYGNKDGNRQPFGAYCLTDLLHFRSPISCRCHKARNLFRALTVRVLPQNAFACRVPHGLAGRVIAQK